MSSDSNAQSSDQPQSNASLHSDDENRSKKVEDDNEEEEEDEEEDVDFNPFLKDTPSPDASSSLSSEIEELDGDSSKRVVNEVRNYDVGDSEHGEEVVMQTTHALCTENGKRLQVHTKSNKRKSDHVSQSENESLRENADKDDSLDDEDEDAIWKRTRARYSLASFTLDELETFLQETDDEDDLQNVDDEEEYRKFLAAVLQGGDDDSQFTQGYENADYEDEDNDADFEIELEELLESDVDDKKRDKDQNVENERGGRRPETRQNRRQKASAQYKKKLLEQSKRPLRPLLPIMPNGPVASLPSADGKVLTPEPAPSYLSSAAGHGLINGFTPRQIGQLHCLIHEHVQLLIQVFSLCVLDPSRQQIASQIQGLIFEMLRKRDEVIACRSVPYPCVCFHSSYMCPSVIDELPNSCPSQCTESSSAPNMQMPITQDISTTMGRNNHVSNGQINASQTARLFWVPLVNGPLVSILDVAPLNLVGRFMDDVFNAVREYRQRHLDSSCDTWNEREPIFQLPHFPSASAANDLVSKGNMPHAASVVPLTAGQQPPKKTLAASIVENVKKQSVALVPKDISKLAQRFIQLFNPALFPHKPPPAAVANRVLFTDTEDELLALGMMQYNTDWRAIQQRFLPCKSKHQIFVRQKNRCSSKAPENPIKAVRRMKTSPLTAEEIECIHEGLRVLKHDWMSVWRFIVPHRDPSLLPRQWRIALGTQRSYRSDAAKKEKRRIYELNRRRCKTADLANWKQDNRLESTGGVNNNGDDYVDNSNEAYVHQAFLADWKPDASNFISSARPFLNLRDQNLPTGALPSEGINTRNQSHIDNMHGFPYAHFYQYPHILPHFTNFRHGSLNSVPQNCQVSDKTQNAVEAPMYLWPHRTGRTPGTHLVKLAPDLPPVNLPPTVRVISQAAFKSNQSGVPTKLSTSGDSTGDAREENVVTQLPNTSLATCKRDRINQVGDKIEDSCPEDLPNSHPEESAIHQDSCGAEERVTESDLQMHPLLFQPPEDGVSYYPLTCSTGASSSFTFFSANHPQLNLSLFHSPHSANHGVDCLSKFSKTKESATALCGIDFHPLLQRAEEESADFAAACSKAQQYVCLGGKSSLFQNPVGVHKSPVNSGLSVAGAKPSCPIEKANELDLEIHLSSTSAMEKIRRQKDTVASNQSKSSTSALNSGNAKSKNPCHHCENCSAVQSNLVSGADASAVPSSSNDGRNMDDLGEQSAPEIVMEQEELSDSDEDSEEHVQFECEEMADSDGDEGLGCDPIAEVRDKDFPNYATEEATTDSDYGDKQGELRSPVHPSGNTPISMKGKLNLTSLGKDATNGSWLTLDSRTPVDPPSMKAKHEECIIGVCPVAKNVASGRPNRSCKKTAQSAKSGATEKDVIGMAQQLSLGLLAVSTLKKPRKRASRSNKGLSTGRINETRGFDQDKVG